MISKKMLTQRVSLRKQQISSDKARLDHMTSKLSEFIADIKNRSVVFNLLKNLTVWKDLEELVAQM